MQHLFHQKLCNYHAYGAPTDKTEMINLIAQAVDMGYTFF